MANTSRTGILGMSQQAAAARRAQEELLKAEAHGSAMLSQAASRTPAWLSPYLPMLKRCRLFSGLSNEEIAALLPCLGAQTKRFEEGEFVLRAGDSTSRVQVVLEGSVDIIREDWWGNRNIVSSVGEGRSFAEAYACTPASVLSVSAVATQPTRLLSLEAPSMIRSCAAACSFHGRLMENLVAALAEGNLRLNSKLSYLSQRSTREKILAYLSDESRRQGSSSFAIPFNRQQLADYLSVNRSALSAELSRMRGEGIVDFERSRFTLPQDANGAGH